MLPLENAPNRTKTFAVFAIGALLCGSGLSFPFAALADPAPQAVSQGDPLEDGFRDPPQAARPRVWWHWLDGNISEDGIEKDLAWMKRVGLGGAQTFDGSFALPKVVERRITYMSPEWQGAFRHAATLANGLGLELGIAASAGWSESGGPWVKPQDAMKKLVWSETIVRGGRRFDGVLRLPPTITGLFQDLAPHKELSAVAKPPIPDFYADAAVFAWRVHDMQKSAVPTFTLADGKALDGTALLDGSYATGVEVPAGTSENPGMIVLTYSRPQTIRSASLFIADIADLYSAATVVPRLEASMDGIHWRRITDIRLGIVPTTISFAPVVARYFRFVLVPAPPAAGSATISAPGYAGFSGPGKPRQKLDIVDLRLSQEARVNEFEVKAGFSAAADYSALDADVGSEANGVPAGDVLDLTSRMRPDGSLDWTVPQGEWRVVRMGYSLTGALNHPASAEATGLEVDKLDAAAVRRYFETYLGRFKETLGPGSFASHGLKALVNDSTEVGPFNWTPAMLDQFRRLRGYDARPWLPVLTGTIVESRAKSDAFLFDFRRTIADLHASEHYATVAAVAHENGLRWYSEALEGGRTSLGDNMDMRRFADVPMAAMWAFRPEDGPKFPYLVDIRGAASVAHLFGQNVVAAESMTSTRFPWAHSPSDLRPVIDAEFANGVNLPVIHTSVHQPVDKKPGLSMWHIGQFFTRNETWSEMARPWVDYMARTGLLLQQGRFVADVAYFYGEEEPTPIAGKAAYADGPTRNGYDYVNATVLQKDFKVDAGALVAPSGARYRLLYLGGSSARMTLPMLRRIAELADAGAVIAGDAPAGSPALQDDPVEYAALVRRLWSGSAVTSVGAGQVVSGHDVDAALRTVGVAPDFAIGGARSDSQIRFVHRQLDDGDIYFVSNGLGRREGFDARFRVAGKAPEIWRADTGAITRVSYRIEGNETVVPLTMAANDSFFVVFRRNAAAQALTLLQSEPRQMMSLDDGWNVAFEAGRGAPRSLAMGHLAPLNEQTDPGIKYFSGVATYTKDFSVPTGYRSGAPVLLDLGRVGDLAEVRLNGIRIGTVWHAPFQVDIGKALRNGKNHLEVRVANLWVNRLIGDAQTGASKIAFTVMPAYKADAPLRPAGLIGPVTLSRVANPRESN
nr:glycosyl hydrolase [Novosphingobium sp. PhB165]